MSFCACPSVLSTLVLSRAMPTCDVHGSCAAAKADGMSSEMGDRLAALGAHGGFPSNIERDLTRCLAQISGVGFNVLYCRTCVRDPLEVAKRVDVGALLPHEIAHWVWRLNPDKFANCFRLIGFNDYGLAQSNGTRSGFRTTHFEIKLFVQAIATSSHRFIDPAMMAPCARRE